MVRDFHGIGVERLNVIGLLEADQNLQGGEGTLESLARFMTNPAGSAIVDAMGPIRQLVQPDGEEQRRYLVIAPGTYDQHGAPVQVQSD